MWNLSLQGSCARQRPPPEQGQRLVSTATEEGLSSGAPERPRKGSLPSQPCRPLAFQLWVTEWTPSLPIQPPRQTGPAEGPCPHEHAIPANLGWWPRQRGLWAIPQPQGRASKDRETGHQWAFKTPTTQHLNSVPPGAGSRTRGPRADFQPPAQRETCSFPFFS